MDTAAGSWARWTDVDERPPTKAPAAWPRVVFIVIVLLALGALVFSGPPRETLARIASAVDALGPWGPLALVGLCVVFCLLVIPASILCVTAGALFGLWKGFLLIFIGMNLGAAAAFMMGRTLAQPWAMARFGGHPWFRALGRAVGENGFTTVALSRLSPAFPFFVVNYLLALTEVRLGAFVAGTAVGMIPGTLGVVFLGTVARQSVQGESKTWWQWLLLGGGILATVAVVWVVGRRAKQLLNERLED
ncbi:MAG: TVP38/TMEM64 family protein [Limisphaerales bacterium]